MRVRQFVAVMVAGAATALAAHAQGPGGKPAEPGDVKPVVPAKPVVGTWEVRYTDDSTMKLTLLEESVGLLTPHGTLQIPVRDIKKIEFGTRLSDADQKAVEVALSDLAGTDAAKREAAKAALLEVGTKALPAVQRAAKPQTGTARAPFTQVIDTLSARLPHGKAAPRDTDVIHTDESVIAGRLAVPALRVNTFQFGEQKLKVTDVTVMQVGKLAVAVRAENLEMLAENMVMQVALQRVGQTVGVRVTGAVNGAVWGSGPYTSDSSLGMAAVHAGVLKVGETGVVRVKFLPNFQQYGSSTQNGVTTSAFGPFQSGSFEILPTP